VSTKHLLLDAQTVAKVVGATLVPGRATKHPANPLFSDANAEQRKPWEVRYDNMQPNVYYDQGKYRLWYSSWTTCQSSASTQGTSGDACSTTPYWPCSGIVAPHLGPAGRIPSLLYAESDDGVTWSKPRLGVVSDSSTTSNKTDFASNNIVLTNNDGSGVYIDASATDPAQRYKLFGELAGNKALATSPDGYHWNISKAGPSDKLLDPHGTHNNLVFDPASGRYYGFGRVSNSPFRTQSVAVSKGPDFLGKWDKAIPCACRRTKILNINPMLWSSSPSLMLACGWAS